LTFSQISSKSHLVYSSERGLFGRLPVLLLGSHSKAACEELMTEQLCSVVAIAPTIETPRMASQFARSATSGLMRDARRAGMYPETAATATSNSAIPP
jgi:hypothetical protein